MINEFLRKTRKTNIACNMEHMEKIRPHIICNDGFIISVQASEFHYCNPRIYGADKYETVELGYPSRLEPLIMEYAENKSNPTGTIYAYVPVEIVNKVIEKHGGILDGYF